MRFEDRSEPLAVAQRALELAMREGADEVAVRVNRHDYAEFRFRDGSIEQVQQNTTRGLQLQVYVGQRYSTHATTALQQPALENFIRDAVALTRLLEPDPYRALPDPSLYEGRSEQDLELVDSEATSIPRETCLDWLAEMDAVCHRERRTISAASSLGYGCGSVALVASNGFAGASANSRVNWGSKVTLDEGDGRRPEAAHYVTALHLQDLPVPVTVAEETLRRALQRLGSRKVASRKATLVVDPQAGGRLLGAVIGALSAEAIQQKRSFLADKKESRVAAPLLSIVDHPLLPRGLGSRHFDGEGIAAKAIPIIEAGILKNYYVGNYYGRKLDWKPTTGGVSNLIIAPGSSNRDELIGQIEDGILVDSWLGGNTDGTTGAFSIGLRGHLIEQGRLMQPVGEMNITGNLKELLQQLVAVGNDPYRWSSWRTPTLVFRDVQFSGF